MPRNKKAGAKDRRMQNSRAPARRGSHAAEREAAAAAQPDVKEEEATASAPPQEPDDAETSNDPIDHDKPLEKRLGKAPVWRGYAILESPTPNNANNAASSSAQPANTASVPSQAANDALSRTPLEALTQQYELMQNTIFSRNLTISGLQKENSAKDDELKILGTHVTQLMGALAGSNDDITKLKSAREEDARKHKAEVEMVKKVCREAVEHVRSEEVDGLKKQVGGDDGEG